MAVMPVCGRFSPVILTMFKVSDEKEFLPAAVEILETPASPLKHLLTLGICLLFVLTVLWAWFGRLDVVVEAEGRIIPRGHVKTISPVQVARVKTLYVEEGSYVDQGEVLVELEPNPSDQETLVEQPLQDILSAQLTLLRTEVLLEQAQTEFFSQPDVSGLSLQHFAHKKDIHFLFEPTAQRWASENHALHSELASFLSADHAMTRQVEEFQAVLSADQEELKRLQLLLPIHNKLADASKGLHEKKMLSEVEWLSRREKQIDTSQQLSVIRQRLNEHQARLQSAIAGQQQKRQEFYARHHREHLQASQHLDHARAILKKARQRQHNQSLLAPVSGYVQQLQVRSSGDVVQPAQPIMIVVPENVLLEAEVMVQNKDIRWITRGQPVKVKVESFPYTRYGYLNGQVRRISSDAVNDEQRGWVYPVRITLEQTGFDVNQQHLSLQPGMTLTADVVVGQRRLLEFFLSPLLRYQKETFRVTM